MKGVWKLGRVGGVDLFADPSLAVIAVLATINLWLAFSDASRFPGLSSSVAFVLAVTTTALFLLSILAHELAHAAVFKARGIPVRGITLYLFGGATEADGEATRPGDEFLVAAAGPFTTGALGLLFLAVHVFGGAALSKPVRVGMFGWLAVVNLLMAGFNLLPGFPLDGGRVLLAAIWRATGDKGRALHITARVGQAMAAAIVAAGLILGLRSGNLLFGAWPAMVGVFLFRASTAALTDRGRQMALETATARDAMSPPPPVIPADMSVAMAMERHLQGHGGEAFPVMENGLVLGFVSLRSASSVPLDRPVREALLPAGAVTVVEPSQSMAAVLAAWRSSSAPVVLVVGDGRLVGVIEPQDLDRLLRRGPRGGGARDAAGVAAGAAPPRPDLPSPR